VLGLWKIIPYPVYYMYFDLFFAVQVNLSPMSSKYKSVKMCW